MSLARLPGVDLADQSFYARKCRLFGWSVIPSETKLEECHESCQLLLPSSTSSHITLPLGNPVENAPSPPSEPSQGSSYNTPARPDEPSAGFLPSGATEAMSEALGDAIRSVPDIIKAVGDDVAPLGNVIGLLTNEHSIGKRRSCQAISSGSTVVKQPF